MHCTFGPFYAILFHPPDNQENLLCGIALLEMNYCLNVPIDLCKKNLNHKLKSVMEVSIECVPVTLWGTAQVAVRSSGTVSCNFLEEANI